MKKQDQEKDFKGVLSRIIGIIFGIVILGGIAYGCITCYRACTEPDNEQVQHRMDDMREATDNSSWM